MSNHCHICGETIDELTDKKVLDHDHITGQYRGAAHNSCNLNYQYPKFLNVYFHNGKNYDFHYLVRELNYDRGAISVLANTEERYISITKKVAYGIDLRFLDSYLLMSASLDSLAKALTPDELHCVSEHFSGEKFDLSRRKGIFPYTHIDSWDRLQETCLPPRESFYDTLKKKHISDLDYQHAQNVWRVLDIKSMAEYSDLYLQVDVALLCDCLTSFRKLSMTHYNLDPCYYYTIPGLSFDAGLKYSKVEIELLSDYDLYLLFEGAIRGGSTQLISN